MSSPATTAPLLGEPLPIELMNTVWADRSGVHDALASAAGVVAWLTAVAGRVDAASPELGRWLEDAGKRQVQQVHRDLTELRDAARRLAALRTGDDRPAAQSPVTATQALTIVNRYAATAPSWAQLTWPEGEPPSATTVTSSPAGLAFVSGLARATIALMADEGPDALRACRAPGCVLYFRRQHARREWCSASCGNRARQARHYRRHHGRAG